MHPLRKLRESGKPTPAQVRELLADNRKPTSHAIGLRHPLAAARRETRPVGLAAP
jgi:hypothetical protein